MEELDRSGRSDVVYAKVKKLSRKSGKAARSTTIKDRDGKLLTEPDKIRERWKEYIEILYDKEGKPEAEMTVERETSVNEDNKGSELLTSEIVEAIFEGTRRGRHQGTGWNVQGNIRCGCLARRLHKSGNDTVAVKAQCGRL